MMTSALFAAIGLVLADAPCLVEPSHVLELGASATTNRYPDADCVWLSDRVEIVYGQDGSFTFRNEEWIKPLTARGARALGQFSAHFNTRFSEATLEDVSFLRDDGGLDPVPFRETLKVSTDNHSLHMNIVDPASKVVSCSVPGVAPGTIVRRLRTERTFKSRLGSNWSLRLPIESSSPILESLVTVTGPKTLPLVCERLGNVRPGTVERLPDEDLGDGRFRASWLVHDMPQVFREPMMPDGVEALASLGLSTFPDWPAVSRWYWGLAQPHLARTNAAMTEKVEELVRDAADDAARISAIFTFVSQKVRYMGLTLEDDSPGYEPHDIDVTFGNLYGVCRDKAALLAALLRLAGYEAYPTLINSGAAMDPDVPSPYFNHAVVAVDRTSVKGDISAFGQRMDEKYLLLDATDEMTKDLLPGYLAGMSYLVARPEGEGLRSAAVATSDENLLDVETSVFVEPDGSAQVDGTLVLNGVSASRYRRLFASLEPRYRCYHLLAEMCRNAKNFGSAELLSATFAPDDLTDTSRPMSIRLSLRIPDFVGRGAESDVFTPPFVTHAFATLQELSFATLFAVRRYPLRFRSTLGVRERVTIRTREGLAKPLALPPSTNLVAGAWSYAYSTAAEDGAIVLSREERLSDIRMGVDDFAAFREARAAAAAHERTCCRFVSFDSAAANVRKLVNRHVSWVRGPYDWVSTNVAVEKVLTVGGKESCAEIHLPFNPPSRDLRLVSAATIAADGSVHPIEPSAVNVMDSENSSASPRYGNGRLLVANLPSVEVGSTVSTVVERVVHDAASPFFVTASFASADPADLIEEELHFAPGLRPAIVFEHDNGRVVTLDETDADGWRTLRWSSRRTVSRPYEWSSPAVDTAAPTVYATLMDWTDYGRLVADERAAVDGESSVARALAKDLVKTCTTPDERISTICGHIAKNVHVVMTDSEWRQCRGTRFFSPDRSLRDGYASTSDRAALLAAMLEAVGFDCEIRLAALDYPDEMLQLAIRTGFHYAFSKPMVHAEWRTGIWPFKKSETFDLSVSATEYDLPRATFFADAAFFRPADGAFGRFDPPEAAFADRRERRFAITIEPSGDARVACEDLTFGRNVGAFRKKWTEMTPEFRARQHQVMARDFAVGSVPVGSLETDVTSNPARLAYEIRVPRLATVTPETLDVSIPVAVDEFWPMIGALGRIKPISCHEFPPMVTEAKVVFPKGYLTLDRVAEPFEIVTPNGERWGDFAVEQAVEDGRLVLTLRLTLARESAELAPEYASWLRFWKARCAAAFGSLGVRR